MEDDTPSTEIDEGAAGTSGLHTGLLRAVIDSSTTGMVLVDSDGLIRLCNAMMTDIFGYSREELIGQSVEALVPHAHATQHPGQRKSFHADPEPRLMGEQRDLYGRHKSGRNVAIEVGLNAVDAGEQMVLASVVDITARKAAEADVLRLNATLEQRVAELRKAAKAVARLERTMAEQAAAYRMAQVGLCYLDQDLRYVHINERLAEINGRPVEEHIGRTLREVLPEVGEGLAAEMQAVLDSAKPLNGTAHIETPAHPGVMRWYAHDFHPNIAEDGSVRGVSCIVRDITAIVRAEEERAKYEARLQHTEKLDSLGRLAGGVAHDFNNLLVVMLGNAELALMDLPQVAPARESVEAIKTAGRRAADIAEQMLIFSGMRAITRRSFSVNELLEQTEHDLRESVSPQVTLTLDYSESVPLVEGDPAMIRQALVSLVTNASEAIGENTGTVRISTGIVDAGSEFEPAHFGTEPLGDRDYVSIEVDDDGCGMGEEVRSKVFDPFFSTKFTGRGLGLAAVVGIMRGHEGIVDAHSVLGEGSAFKLLLPASPHQLGEAVEAPPPSEAPSRRYTVLVADDERGVRRVARRLLERSGFIVLTAEDGQECVDLFREHAEEIDAVLLDMMMPKMGGEQCFAELRAMKSDVRVAFVSGYSDVDLGHALPNDALSVFIAKPFDGETLIGELRALLAVAAPSQADEES